jgi:hypothetical protein
MQWFLYDFFEVIVDPRTVRRSFERRKWSRKALKSASISKNDFARTEWISRLKDYHADQLVFVDESAANAVTSDMKKGFCERDAPAADKKDASVPVNEQPAPLEPQALAEELQIEGQLLEATLPLSEPKPESSEEHPPELIDGQLPEGQLPLPTDLPTPLPPPGPVNMKRDARWSVLPAYTMSDGYLPGFLVVQGNVSEEMFSGWLQQHVLPQCSPFPGPRSVLVMDAAAIHNTQVSNLPVHLVSKGLKPSLSPF